MALLVLLALPACTNEPPVAGPASVESPAPTTRSPVTSSRTAVAPTDEPARPSTSTTGSPPASPPGRPPFTAGVQPIDDALAVRMTPTSYRAGCPTPLRDLRYLRLSYVDFAGQVHRGELVVSARVAADVVGVFHRLFDAGYPIRSMRLVDDFDGSDDASMAADNTSAFNCRPATGGGGWSQHSYGEAVDVNPRENPYVRGATVLPPLGRSYTGRPRRPGVIHEGDVVTRAFGALNWGWGGRWTGVKDYQHFSRSGR
ncbi:MAG TPA: M15 family metallopeptidase [Dermatophilaceae bacterium]|nr:M15 family metallopeptidase [Dermatophilaceae bacterium]